jgi:hypothetical protein
MTFDDIILGGVASVRHEMTSYKYFHSEDLEDPKIQDLVEGVIFALLLKICTKFALTGALRHESAK